MGCFVMRKGLLAAGVAAVAVLAAGCGSSGSSGSSGASGSPVVLRLGFLANITHEPALVGLEKGFFAKQLGKNVTLKTTVFSSGTEETTAILAGQLDAAYVGPNPAINAWQKSNGTAIKIVSGAASGGASLVVKSGITAPPSSRASPWPRRRWATPRTSRLRYWLKQHGLTTTPTGGGDVAIKPIKPNSAAVLQFKSGQIDGGWEPEPYATEMVLDGGKRAGERGQPVAGRQVRHHQPGRHAVFPEGAPQHGQRAAQGPDRGQRLHQLQPHRRRPGGQRRADQAARQGPAESTS